MADIKICDICGKVISRSAAKTQRGVMSTIGIVEAEHYYLTNGTNSYEICLDCKVAIDKFIEQLKNNKGGSTSYAD